MIRSTNHGRHIVPALVAMLLLGLTGCMGGAAQATSWTGLTVVDDTLYAADIEQVAAFDIDDGEPLWVFPRDPKDDYRGQFYATPTVVGDMTIVASQLPASGMFKAARNVVWALDSLGRDLWSFEEAGGQFVEGGAAAGNTFIIGNSDQYIYALDVNTGDLLWKFQTGHRVWATPLIVDDTVYIGSMDRHLYALDLADGHVIWDFAGGGAFASQPVLQDGTLYIGAFDDKVYAIDAQTGAEQWSFAGENWFWGLVALDGELLYAADVDGNVYAIDATSASEVWRRSLVDEKERKTPVRAGVVLSEDGTLLFVGNRNGTFYALSTADGREVWSSTSDGQVFSEAVVVGSTVIYPMIYGTDRIRALAVDNGREVWVYAKADESK